MRPAAIIAILAAPAAAQGATGECVMDLAWTGGPGYASVGDCGAPDEGALLTLTCEDGRTRASVALPSGAEDGAPADATLMIDGRRATLSGTGAYHDLTGWVHLENAPVPAATVERLAAGRNGLVSTSTESAPFHLTGSRQAITAMLDGC